MKQARVAMIALVWTVSLVVHWRALALRTTAKRRSTRTHLHHSYEKDSAAQDALERTAAHLQKLQQRSQSLPHDFGLGHLDAPPKDPLGEQFKHRYQTYIQQPANTLKELLKQRKLPRNGRKPDLATRLAEDDMSQMQGPSVSSSADSLDIPDIWVSSDNEETGTELTDFAGLSLSQVAGTALYNFRYPTLIQQAAIPALANGESLVLHAETGSGKTIAYLLPLTETLWRSSENNNDARFLVLTPNLELAAQVAGVATALAPTGTVRLVNQPSNLMADGQKQRGEVTEFGGRHDVGPSSPRLVIGSAKTIMYSLYGDGKTPAPCTPKPAAMEFLQSIQCVVLDEVDRLLNVKKSRAEKSYKKIHEKPAAVLIAAIMRLSMGQAQIVAASATVGRPLKRELTRVMGLPFQECPRVVVAAPTTLELGVHETASTGRAVTIPRCVQHFVLEAEGGQSDGKLLTAAYQVIQKLEGPRRILMVLNRGFGLSPQNVVGALKHFRCQPTPTSLLDQLYGTAGEDGGTDGLMEAHRQVSGASGVGESSVESDNVEDRTEYLLVANEDSVRGLHLDGLDLVVVLGRPHTPDEYVHIAGRTGRAGQSGKVLCVVGAGKASSLQSWESMLDINFLPIDTNALGALQTP